MLIINKVSIWVFPAPNTLLFLQLSVSAGTLWILGQFQLLEVDPLEFSKIRQYWGVVIVFLMNIYTNLKALQNSNVETVIVFRACTTLAVSYGDFKFLGRDSPRARLVACLFLIIFGAVIYVLTDSSFKVESYFWVILYFFLPMS